MSWREDPAWPDVDVVMPVRNEADHLAAAIESVRTQGYPGRMRVFLAVAPSDDGTERFATTLAAAVDDVVVVENPDGTTPVGLNRAIVAGSAPVVVRVDGHSLLSEGYIERAVDTLRRTGAGNVGGRQVPQPQTAFEVAVAAVTSSWLGTGGAAYRTGVTAGAVDTVYLGVFDRVAVEAVGLFDPRLVRNQDYELNIRLREAGYQVWYEPDLWVGYRPRSTWRALARQYWEYGWWKAAVLRLHPRSLRLRQLLPPVALAAVVVSSLLVSRRRRWVLVPLAYAGTLLGAMHGRVRRAAVALVIQASWAAGLLAGLGANLGAGLDAVRRRTETQSALRGVPRDEQPSGTERRSAFGGVTRSGGDPGVSA